MQQQTEEELPLLFCKPKGFETSVFKHYFGYHLVEFRSVDLARDIDMIHDWVHSEHALPYWQLNVTIGELYTIYVTILQSPSSHSFIGCYDGKPVCQIDVYLASIDELSKHVEIKQHDCGMHLIMAPVQHNVKGLSCLMTNAFLLHLFSFDEADRVFAEPDKKNEKGNLLLKKCCFTFLKEIQMSYKTANLHVMTRENFAGILIQETTN